MSLTYEIIADGRVQGVGYRRFCLQMAKNCGITGYVRNLTDGSVKIIAQGEPSDLNLFLEFLKKGPVFAEILSFKAERLTAATVYKEFSIKH